VTRLDRARIALAYEHLRYRSRFDGDDEWKTVSSAEAWSMVDKSAITLPYLLRVKVAPELYVGDARILRARLALYLRALLRADAGNFGPRTRRPRPRVLCRSVEHTRHDDPLGLRCRSAACDCWTFTRRIRPLWESAPAHRGTT